MKFEQNLKKSLSLLILDQFQRNVRNFFVFVGTLISLGKLQFKATGIFLDFKLKIIQTYSVFSKAGDSVTKVPELVTFFSVMEAVFSHFLIKFVTISFAMIISQIPFSNEAFRPFDDWNFATYKEQNTNNKLFLPGLKFDSFSRQAFAILKVSLSPTAIPGEFFF